MPYPVTAITNYNELTGGYNNQRDKSFQRGQQGYDQLSANYAELTADALETRARNMARVDQYGASMRDDLNRKNAQNLAIAGQSAIKRGLGNTTVYDSLQRGQNSDNTRQLLSLEDQLLQNRISTDANLSKTYQGTLQSRAQGLANQWSLNTQADDQNFKDIANIYTQGFAQDNANQQAALNRQMQMDQTPVKYRLIRGKVYRSFDGQRTWQLDTDQ